MFPDAYIASLVQIADAVIDNLRVSDRLIVGPEDRPLEITADTGIAIPMAINDPIGAINRIGFYSTDIEDPTASIEASADTDTYLTIRVADQPFGGHNLILSATGNGGRVLVNTPTLDVTGATNLAGQLDVAGPPAAASRHAAGFAVRYVNNTSPLSVGSGSLFGNAGPFTYIAGRQYAAQLTIGQFTGAAAGDLWQFTVETTGSNQIGHVRHRVRTTGAGGDGTPALPPIYFTRSGSAHLRVRFTRITGAGGATIEALPPGPALALHIFDMGPV